MANKQRGSLSAREQIAEIKASIEYEREIRRSLKISTDERYYAGQKTYLEQQIAEFQKSLDLLTERFTSGARLIEESFSRQRILETRLLTIQERGKLEKVEALKAELLATAQNLGMSVEDMLNAVRETK